MSKVCEHVTKDAQKELNEQISIQNKVLNDMEKELVELKNDVSEIKKMLAQLTEKMVESNG